MPHVWAPACVRSGTHVEAGCQLFSSQFHPLVLRQVSPVSVTFPFSRLAGLQLLADSPVPRSHPATGLLGLEVQTTLPDSDVNSRAWTQWPGFYVLNHSPTSVFKQFYMAAPFPPSLSVTCDLVYKVTYMPSLSEIFSHLHNLWELVFSLNMWVQALTSAVKIASKPFTH